MQGSLAGQRSTEGKAKQNAERLRKKKKKKEEETAHAVFALVLNYHNPS